VEVAGVAVALIHHRDQADRVPDPHLRHWGSQRNSRGDRWAVGTGSEGGGSAVIAVRTKPDTVTRIIATTSKKKESRKGRGI